MMLITASIPVLSGRKLTAAAMGHPTPLFLVLSPVWNAAPWVGNCLESVRRQTYPRIRHLWIDDASTDGTARILGREVRAGDLILNAARRFPSYNVWNALTHQVREDCLVGLLDGDDWLLEDTAVAQMVEMHRDGDVAWSTHLVLEKGPNQEIEAAPEPENPLHRRQGAVRRLGWRPTHFFSFRRRHFLKIPPSAFQTADGRWFEAMYDMALSVPLIEMAGWERCRYLPRPLYAYNRLRPENDDKVRRNLQLFLEGVIREGTPVKKIP